MGQFASDYRSFFGALAITNDPLVAIGIANGLKPAAAESGVCAYTPLQSGPGIRVNQSPGTIRLCSQPDPGTMKLYEFTQT